MLPYRICAGLLLAGTSVLAAQFEVASVRISVPTPAAGGGAGRTGGLGGGGTVCLTHFAMDAGRIDIRCLTLTALISHAFGVLPDRIEGPDWLAAGNAQRFDIAAKLPEGASTAQMPEMLQTLLKDRFKLAVHRENRPQTVYALAVAKGGVKAKKAAPEQDAPADVEGAVTNIGGGEAMVVDDTMSSPSLGTLKTTRSANGADHVQAPNITMDGLAGLLSSMMVGPMPIVNQTGLKGRYSLEIDFDWQEVAASHSPGPGMDPAQDPAVLATQIEAFRHQLQKAGLRLERRKAPVDMLVVDRVEKTPTDN